MKYGYLRSLQLCEGQGIRGKLKKHVCKTCAFDPSDLYGDQVLSSSLVLKMSNKEDFNKFKAKTEEKDFFTQ